ncbi:MAG: 16S rRNA (adenine(1518)-N(6)/adenine(1519)-N(6))-dimethyltransferase RsmA [Bacteroidota bacterium]
MNHLTAKKHLGQHFLKDQNIARKIVGALRQVPQTIIEVGPGAGALTELLVQQKKFDIYLVEVDTDLVALLKKTYPELQERIIAADFLQLALSQLHDGAVTIVGNFPYNIASQIFFKVWAHRQQVHEVVGMIQKEVAERLLAKPGSKAYGILSVLLQAFYHLEYLFTVGPHVFYPRPKVQSAVIRLRRNDTLCLDSDEDLFLKVIKTGFQQRRKTLRNALKPLLPPAKAPSPLLAKRAEQLTVADFVALTQYIAAG